MLLVRLLQLLLVSTLNGYLIYVAVEQHTTGKIEGLVTNCNKICLPRKHQLKSIYISRCCCDWDLTWKLQIVMEDYAIDDRNRHAARHQ